MLQCIIVSLLVIDLLILLTRRQGIFVWVAASVGVAAVLATPWIWAQDFTGRMLLSLALFLNPHGVSLLPLFPWISFVIAGSCAGHFFLNAVAKRAGSRYMNLTLLASMAAIVVALVARDFEIFRAWKPGFYITSPLYVVIRLGCVLIVCAGLYFMEKGLGWTPQVIRLAGRESLLVYCAHLLLIFGILRQPSVVRALGGEAGYGICFLLSLALILVMLLSARIWHGWKCNYPRFAKSVLIAVFAISVVIFLLR